MRRFVGTAIGFGVGVDLDAGAGLGAGVVLDASVGLGAGVGSGAGVGLGASATRELTDGDVDPTECASRSPLATRGVAVGPAAKRHGAKRQGCVIVAAERLTVGVGVGTGVGTGEAFAAMPRAGI